jgi:hypothetical protein
MRGKRESRPRLDLTTVSNNGRTMSCEPVLGEGGVGGVLSMKAYHRTVGTQDDGGRGLEKLADEGAG